MSQNSRRHARRQPSNSTEPSSAPQSISAALDSSRSHRYEVAFDHSDGEPLLARELYLSHALVEAAITHLDLDALLPALLDPIKDVMHVDNVAILLCTEDGKNLLVCAAHGLEAEAVGWATIPIGKGFAGRIAASRQLLVVPNLVEFDAVNPVLRARLRSVAGVPLVAGDRLLGVLHIGTGQLHDFTPHELTLLRRVAEHVALAIDRALLYRAEREARHVAERQTQRARETLDALFELAGATVGSPGASADSTETTVDDIALDSEAPADNALSQDDAELQHLASLCCHVIGCDRVAIVSIDPGTQLLRPITVSGSSPRQERLFRASFANLRLADRFGSEAAAQLKAGESVLLDLTDMALDHPARILSRRYFLLSPMLSEGILTGYIGVNFGDDADDYSPENRALAHTAAQLIGTVMERQLLAHEREEARADALSWERAKRQMDEFLSIAGHELRTPLTSAKANVQIVTRMLDRLLQREGAVAISTGTVPHTQSPLVEGGSEASQLVLLEQALDLLRRATRQFTRQERLINDLLDVSRIDAGKLEFRFAACDLVELVRDSVAEQRATHPERIIHFSAPDRLEHPLLVSADADRLIQVMDNLLSNALKYSETDTLVSIRVRAEGNVARCEVQDHGPGLRVEERERVWQRFYRASGIEPQTGSSPGLGLGLYISKTIIERHGGEVGIDSTPGEGSTFWFSLPLSPRDEA